MSEIVATDWPGVVASVVGAPLWTLEPRCCCITTWSRGCPLPAAFRETRPVPGSGLQPDCAHPRLAAPLSLGHAGRQAGGSEAFARLLHGPALTTASHPE